MNVHASSPTLRFGPFELKVETGELWKSGTKIRLQGQSLRVLLCLLEEPGRFRSREELRRNLWPDGTFVDFDHSLNVAVNRLRERLGDSAETPRYVETVAGVGYRFIAPVEASQPPLSESPRPELDSSGDSSRVWKRPFLRAGVAAVCALLLAALTWFPWNLIFKHGAAVGGSHIDSVAVLPLTNIAGDDREDYFADGMTEELITELASLGSFRVISRTSIMRYKKTVRSLPEIGRELNVNALVEGTVRRSGDRVRITVRLVSTSPEHLIWADAYEGDIHDVLTLQRDVASDIAGNIQTKLGVQPAPSLPARKRLDPETYEDYLRGRHFLARRDAESMNKAAGYFQMAVQRDPQYAQAYAGLAATYDLLGTYELRPPEKSFPQAIEFAGKALQLDSTLSEAYTARASAESFYELDWVAADRDFQRAIALDPSSAFAHHWYAEHFNNVGKAERSVSELKRARDLDPLSLPINSILGIAYRAAHHYDEAVQQCKKTVELDPNFSMGHWCLGEAYMGERQYLAAVSELERATALGATPLLICDLGCAYAGVGKDTEARAILKALEQNAQFAYVSPYLIASIYCALGEKDEAFKWLYSAFDRRDSHIVELSLDPLMDPLRSDPRFLPLIQRLHLPK